MAAPYRFDAQRGCAETRWCILKYMLWCIPFALSVAPIQSTPSDSAAESRAVKYLSREVPSWFKSNRCFSCHNNGDASRALFLASRKGFRIPPDALKDTLEWLRRPQDWDKNKGDPGFSDKRLADIQFSFALDSAVTQGFIKVKSPLEVAARKLIRSQAAEGSWPIDEGATAGSPATYGTPLATYQAWRILKQLKIPEAKSAVSRARSWLRKAKRGSTVDSAALLLFYLADSDSVRSGTLAKRLSAAQTRDGGWGPFPDSRPEAFDTALALIALSRISGHKERVRRGRVFLEALQNPDGSWPETTRPPNSVSYAQRVSTTAWSLLALLETRPKQDAARFRMEQ